MLRAAARIGAANSLLSDGIRKLRVVWIYVRGPEEIRCEIRPAGRAFTLVISHSDGGIDTQECASLDEATARHRALQQRLVDHGWQLRESDPSPAL